MHQTQWSTERRLPPPVSLTSQSHHEKPPEVTSARAAHSLSSRMRIPSHCRNSACGLPIPRRKRIASKRRGCFMEGPNANITLSSGRASRMRGTAYSANLAPRSHGTPKSLPSHERRQWRQWHAQGVHRFCIMTDSVFIVFDISL